MRSEYKDYAFGKKNNTIFSKLEDKNNKISQVIKDKEEDEDEDEDDDDDDDDDEEIIKKPVVQNSLKPKIKEALKIESDEDEVVDDDEEESDSDEEPVQSFKSKGKTIVENTKSIKTKTKVVNKKG